MTVKETLLASDYIIAALRNMIDGTPTPRIPEGTSYGVVYNLAKSHSLHGAVFAAIETELKNEADPRLYEHWKRERDISFIVNMKQTAEFSTLTELFTKEKISFLPLKGFMLKELYPSPELRVMSDLDIYVSHEHIDRAKELMRGIGYINKAEGIVDDSMIKPPYLLVELHKLVEAKSEFSFSDCKTKENNPYWHLMYDEDFFVFLISHAHKHYCVGGCGIRTVLDLYLYKKKYRSVVDSKVTAEKLSSRGFSEFCADILALGDLWFEGKACERDLSNMGNIIATGGVYGTNTNTIGMAIEKKGKFKYIISRIFPSPQMIKERYRWVRKAPILLPIGYIWRWIQSIFNGRVAMNMTEIAKAEKNQREIEETKNIK